MEIQSYIVPSLQHTTYGNSGSSSSNIKGDSEREFFIELWDISGHERYKDCRSILYSQINGEQGSYFSLFCFILLFIFMFCKNKNSFYLLTKFPSVTYMFKMAFTMPPEFLGQKITGTQNFIATFSVLPN